MLAGIGVILLVVGAIIAFGVDAAVEGADLQAIGLIIMAGGGLALVVGAIQGAGSMSMGRTKMRSERHVSSDGNHVVEETDVA